MTARAIRLTPLLTAVASPLAIGLVQIEMLFPGAGNAEKRQQARAGLLREITRPALQAGILPPVLVDLLAEQDSIKPSAVRDEIRTGLYDHHGTIAGIVLLRALDHKDENGHTSLSEAFTYAAHRPADDGRYATDRDGKMNHQRFAGQRRHPVTGKLIEIGRKIVEREIWPQFKSVAHFWGATLTLAEPDGAFPCRTDKFLEFLSLANALRKAGVSAKNPKGATVLDEADSVTLPPEIISMLPAVVAIPAFDAKERMP